MANGEIRIVHAIPGRVRLKVAGLRDNPPLAKIIQERLEAVPGIQEVAAKPLTGSVLVLFDPQAITAPESLMTLSETLNDLFPGLDLAQLGDFLNQSLAGEMDVPPWYQPAINFLVGVNARAAQALGSLANFTILVPLALLWFGLPRLLEK
jgi:hypothetical protein